eukprot:scaffold2592_cov395-Prasinococcus_capsulatus_cf.AAC.12
MHLVSVRIAAQDPYYSVATTYPRSKVIPQSDLRERVAKSEPLQECLRLSAPPKHTKITD